MARPHQLFQVIRRTAAGEPVTVADVIVERVGVGLPHERAAGSAGIDRMTENNYRRQAAQARGRIARGESRSGHDRKLKAFIDALERAEDEAELRRLVIIARAAEGGATTTKRKERHGVVRDSAGQPVIDPTTGNPMLGLIEVETTVETLRPEWTAAAWWLERRRGYVRRMEVTGKDGGPLLTEDERAGQLGESLRAFLAGADTQRGLASGDPS